MSSTVTKEALLQVLPDVLRNDEHMQELAEMTAEALSKFWGNIQAPSIYNRIMEQPEEVLDILARDFKVDWYKNDYSLAIKRRIIRDNWYVHKRLGTIGAIRQAISDVWPDSLVEEWFDYGQDPGYFRVILNAGDDSSPVIPIDTDELRKLIRTYKRASSHLDESSLIIRISYRIQVNTTQEKRIYHVPVTGTIPRYSTHGDHSVVPGPIVGSGALVKSYRVRPCGTSIHSLM